jgi:hypothetical protein
MAMHRVPARSCTGFTKPAGPNARANTDRKGTEKWGAATLLPHDPCSYESKSKTPTNESPTSMSSEIAQAVSLAVADRVVASPGINTVKLIGRGQFFGHPVNVLGDAAEPFWHGKEICEILEIRNYRQALGSLDDDEKGGYIVPPLWCPHYRVWPLQSHPAEPKAGSQGIQEMDYPHPSSRASEVWPIPSSPVAGSVEVDDAGGSLGVVFLRC